MYLFMKRMFMVNN